MEKSKMPLLALSGLQLLWGVWMFISMSVHIASSLDGKGGSGVGGRTGFAYVLFYLMNLTIQAITGFLVFKGNWTIETYCMTIATHATWGVGFGFIFIFLFAGDSHQLASLARLILKLIDSNLEVNSTFTGSSAATITALCLWFVTTLVFVFFMFKSKADLLNAQTLTGDSQPSDPSDMGYAPHTDQSQQAAYYNPQGQPPPPNGEYSNYAAPQQDHNGVYS